MRVSTPLPSNEGRDEKEGRVEWRPLNGVSTPLPSNEGRDTHNIPIYRYPDTKFQHLYLLMKVVT